MFYLSVRGTGDGWGRGAVVYTGYVQKFLKQKEYTFPGLHTVFFLSIMNPEMKF